MPGLHCQAFQHRCCSKWFATLAVFWLSWKPRKQRKASGFAWGRLGTLLELGGDNERWEEDNGEEWACLGKSGMWSEMRLTVTWGCCGIWQWEKTWLQAVVSCVEDENYCFPPHVLLCHFCWHEFFLKPPFRLGLTCRAAAAAWVRCSAVGCSHAWYMQF